MDRIRVPCLLLSPCALDRLLTSRSLARSLRGPLARPFTLAQVWVFKVTSFTTDSDQDMIFFNSDHPPAGHVKSLCSLMESMKFTEFMLERVPGFLRYIIERMQIEILQRSTFAQSYVVPLRQMRIYMVLARIAVFIPVKKSAGLM